MSETGAQPTFEEAVARLEEIVSAMESGNLTLDACLVQFEQAIALSRLCAQQLDAAETRLRILTREGGEPVGHELPGC